MNREIKYKAKLNINFLYGSPKFDWVDGYYLKKFDVKENIYIHSIVDVNSKFIFIIDPSTLCQLILKIADVEIYEYDCYFDIKNNRIEYFSYELNGQLGVQSYLLKNNKLEHIHYTLNLEVVKCLRKSILKNDYINIGNWHDGEEYLLDKIKEVEIEN